MGFEFQVATQDHDSRSEQHAETIVCQAWEASLVVAFNFLWHRARHGWRVEFNFYHPA
jgi:hypothetical protein